MRLHFVYVGGIDNNRQNAPYSITRNLGRFLKRKGLDVVYYDWDQQLATSEVGSGDIVLGHPNYTHTTALRVLWQQACRARLLIHPFHHAIPHINLPFDDLARSADAILSICGPYWYDTMSQSPFAHWQPKVTRLDMAVDAASYPYVKTKWNQPGQRSYVYIGRDEPEKGTDILAAAFSRLPYTLHCYGSIGPGNPLLSLPNVVVHGWTDMNRQWMLDLANQSDFIVSTGRSDANPTSLLEGAAWGLIPLCTNESGYWVDSGDSRPEQLSVGGLSIRDIDFTVRRLYEYNFVPEAPLRARSELNRRLVENVYNWERFCDTVWGVLSRLL